VNRQITRLAVVGLVLLAALVVGTTYWQAWAASGLADRQDNAIQRVAEFSVKRGKIYAADGRTVLADNVRRKVDGRTLYFRKYPQRGLAAHIVGYSTQLRSRAGLESSENDFLTGSNTNLSTVLDTTLDKLKGTTVKGNDLHLTLRPNAQRIALNALGGKCGAAVAIEPRTGRVLVSVSSPTYDPNLIEGRYNEAARPKFGCPPFVNRAEGTPGTPPSGVYVPGSAFKVLTAAAAIDSGRFTIDSTFNDPGYCIEYGKQVTNFSDQSGPEVFGRVNFVQAMEHSINAVFCEIGKALGARKILDYAKRFGFYSVPPLETPTNERAASGLYDKGKLFFPKNDFQVDPGRLAFGQERLQVTPLQMAMLTATIANGGLLMRPYVVERVVAPDGSTVTETKPDQLGRAISEHAANDVTTMMEAVVQSGTGTAAQLPGIRVAGKTGTAETGRSHENTTWFVSFAPADNPKVAVAVVLERQSATGGTTAAPIAKSIMEALLR
jgi:peptidoglycan glycosyltransferase